jgi:hypothetical protein
MVKPKERNTKFVDAVMTVPKGTLYPMCGMNLAFDRCGPASPSEHSHMPSILVVSPGFCAACRGTCVRGVGRCCFVW